MKNSNRSLNLLFMFIILLLAGNTIAKTPKNNRVGRNTKSDSNKLYLDTLPGSEEVLEGHVITEEGAWCWFADPRALHYEKASGSINCTNLLGNSDVWKTQNRSTGGKWWPPAMLKFLNLQ